MQDFDQIRIDDDMEDIVGTDVSHRFNQRHSHNDSNYSPTLILDYSETNLNHLFQKSEALLTYEEKRALRKMAKVSGKQSEESSNMSISAQKREQYKLGNSELLDDEEENVDFVEMFNMYRQANQFQKNSSRSDQLQEQEDPNSHTQSQQEAYQDPPQEMEFNNQQPQLVANNSVITRGVAQPRQPSKKMKVNVRPSSATVGGQNNRFITNQNSKRKGQPQVNILRTQENPTTAPQTIPIQNSKGLSSAISFGSQRYSNLQAFPTQILLKTPAIPNGFKFKRARPQSAAKNSLLPAKNLASVTNFTYQKAQSNLAQKSYLPESLKNTDKEKLYEEKINLKKQLNQMEHENQILKTQIMNQQNLLRKKDEQVQLVMRQVFQAQRQSLEDIEGEEFLNQFRAREIHHIGAVSASAFYKGGHRMKGSGSTTKIIKQQETLVQKDSQLSQLKLKMKELNEMVLTRDKELLDLKQTLKFTKVKEYETELRLNVQESQRLRQMLEMEIRKPKIDPRLVQGLQQQNAQCHQIIHNLQQNLQIQIDDFNKINDKLGRQVNKFARLKESRKKIVEQKKRLEKKILILNSKVAQSQTNVKKTQNPSNQQEIQRQNVGLQIQSIIDQHRGEKENWRQRFIVQNAMIEKLVIKMQQYDIDLTEQELLEMQQLQQIQHAIIQADPEFNDRGENNQFSNRPTQLANIEEEDEGVGQGSMAEEAKSQSQMFEDLVDLVVTLERRGEEGGESPLRRELRKAKVETFDSLLSTLRKELMIPEIEEFFVQCLDANGEMLNVTNDNWDQIRETGIQGKIQLALRMGKEQDNYQDEFEEEQLVEQKEFIDKVSSDQVKEPFEELRLVLQINNIKRSHALKYILHGLIEDGQKIKRISIKQLRDSIVARIGFSEERAELMSRYLIEEPDENGKVECKKNLEFQGQTHLDILKIKRKDLHSKFLAQIKDYSLFNGIAITNMLSRIQSIFENSKEELLTELQDQDYDDLGTAPLEDVFKSMRLVGVSPDSLDEEIKNFLVFMAMRCSHSLKDVDYTKFIKIMEEDYSFIEDKSPWLKNSIQYEASSDGIELESSEEEQKEEVVDRKGRIEFDEIAQNELLEKVDEVLALIVQKLPQKQRIRSLTQFIMPRIIPIQDKTSGKQYLILSHDQFVEFLIGTGEDSLQLNLEDQHVLSLLNLLVQEESISQQTSTDQAEDQRTKFILFDEFIELIKTYLKKEQILRQSNQLGINYSILSRTSVEFLFQLRSALMIDQDDSFQPNFSLPVLIRELFAPVIQEKNVKLQSDKAKIAKRIELMDFDNMTDIMYSSLGIRPPQKEALLELKYLLCLDFKYLELVMVVKLDKVMHDLDYISIDLLRQLADPKNEVLRKKEMKRLENLRNNQLKKLKDQGDLRNQNTFNSNHALTYQGECTGMEKQSSVNCAESSNRILGVSHSTKQEKKRKRPDDKKQNPQKRHMFNNETQSNHTRDQDKQSGSKPLTAKSTKQMNSQVTQSQKTGVNKLQEEEDEDSNQMGSISKQRVRSSRGEFEFKGDFRIEQEITSREGEKRVSEDINLDTEINFSERQEESEEKEEGVELEEGVEEYEDDFPEEEIPIDEEDEGIISDNYENFTEDVKVKEQQEKMKQNASQQQSQDLRQSAKQTIQEKEEDSVDEMTNSDRNKLGRHSDSLKREQKSQLLKSKDLSQSIGSMKNSKDLNEDQKMRLSQKPINFSQVQQDESIQQFEHYDEQKTEEDDEVFEIERESIKEQKVSCLASDPLNKGTYPEYTASKMEDVSQIEEGDYAQVVHSVSVIEQHQVNRDIYKEDSIQNTHRPMSADLIVVEAKQIKLDHGENSEVQEQQSYQSLSQQVSQKSKIGESPQKSLKNQHSINERGQDDEIKGKSISRYSSSFEHSVRSVIKSEVSKSLKQMEADPKILAYPDNSILQLEDEYVDDLGDYSNKSSQKGGSVKQSERSRKKDWEEIKDSYLDDEMNEDIGREDVKVGLNGKDESKGDYSEEEDYEF